MVFKDVHVWARARMHVVPTFSLQVTVGDWTGGVGALRSVGGESAPRREIPSRPRIAVGEGISCPLLLHLPQQ